MIGSGELRRVLEQGTQPHSIERGGGEKAVSLGAYEEWGEKTRVRDHVTWLDTARL